MVDGNAVLFSLFPLADKPFKKTLVYVNDYEAIDSTSNGRVLVLAEYTADELKVSQPRYYCGVSFVHK